MKLIKFKVVESNYTPKQHLKWFWWDVKRSIKNRFVQTKVKISGGYSCHCCGAKIPIYWTELNGNAFGRRFFMSNNSEHLYCNNCTLDRITEYFKRSNKVTVGSCDWKKAEMPVISIITKYDDPLADELDLDVRFGGSWWNGHQACLDVFEQALRTMPEDDFNGYTTSFSVYKNGTSYMVDKNGVRYGRSKIVEI